MLDVIEGLEKQFGSEIKGLGGIRRHLLSRKRDAENRPDAAAIIRASVVALDNFAKGAGSWPLEADDFSAVEQGFKRTFRAGRKALARARKQPDDENYHAWRKRVKDHWYHIRLLSGFVGKAIGRREKQLERLSEWLGDDHNIAVLRATSSAESRLFGGRRHLNAFLDLLQELQAQLREKALRQGTRLYAPKPRKLAQRMEHLWTAGRARAKPGPRRKPPATHREVTPAATVA
jgi:hypothetical protein